MSKYSYSETLSRCYAACVLLLFLLVTVAIICG